MSDKVFVDTNILIYAYDIDAGKKHEICKKELKNLWDNGNGVISTQVMQEFYVNVTRKIPEPIPPSKARHIIEQYKTWQVEIITAELILFASIIQERNQLSFWDSLILAAANQANAETLLSEDLNSDQTIESVKIVTPFGKA